ncbi:hypothetical protein [Sphingobacterium kitahiroshimense]|uniref:hypothetical protein n=1 Tax=Sphingobacterium kitahiroshimense TaxID=470446 RepID=UPI003207FBF3
MCYFLTLKYRDFYAEIKFTYFFDHCMNSIRKPPIRLPERALNIIKYIALGLGVVEIVLDD